MELRQLRYFIAVAEELHFRRAAARLHISQPPLSQQIAQLEDELGVRLLNRTRRRVELTAAGEAFLRDARSMLDELEVAVSTARRIDTGQAGVLRVNFVGSALLSIVPGIVTGFRRRRPAVELELRERSTLDQLRALADRDRRRRPGATADRPRRDAVDRGGDARAHGRRDPGRASAGPSAAGAAAPDGRRAAGAVPARAGARLSRPADRAAGRHRDLAPRGPVRAGDADHHRPGGRRDRRLPGPGIGGRPRPGGRHLPPAVRAPRTPNCWP